MSTPEEDQALFRALCLDLDLAEPEQVQAWRLEESLQAVESVARDGLELLKRQLGAE